MITHALKARLPEQYSDYDPIVFFGINQVRESAHILQFLEKIVAESITHGSCISESASEVNYSGQHLFHIKIQFPPMASGSNSWRYSRKALSNILDTLISVIPDTKHESSMHPPDENAPLINIITKYSLWDSNDFHIEFKVKPAAFPCFEYELNVLDDMETETRNEVEDIKETILYTIKESDEGKALLSLSEKLRLQKEEKTQQIQKLQQECGSIGAMIREVKNRIEVIKTDCFYSEWVQEEVEHVKKQSTIEKNRRLGRGKYLSSL